MPKIVTVVTELVLSPRLGTPTVDSEALNVLVRFVYAVAVGYIYTHCTLTHPPTHTHSRVQNKDFILVGHF